MRIAGVFFVISGLFFIFLGAALLASNITSGASETSIFLNVVAILSGISTLLSGIRLCDEESDFDIDGIIDELRDMGVRDIDDIDTGEWHDLLMRHDVSGK